MVNITQDAARNMFEVTLANEFIAELCHGI